MKVLITGASGLVGTALQETLRRSNHEVRTLSRRKSGTDPDQLTWDPAHGTVPARALNGFNAVVHLAGANIAAKRWTRDRKRALRESRVQSTNLLASALATTERKPSTLICASAVGIYGDRGHELITESSSTGDGFLAELGREWEAAAQPARDAGIRVVHLRFGIILAPHGGALAKLLPIFRLGLGGRVGNGRQYWPWISLEDAVGAIVHSLFAHELSGPVNAVAPSECTNREFTTALARALRRPAILPAPAFALRFILGEMADAALLSGQRVQPERLLETRYEFKHPTLESAFESILAPR